VLFQGGYIHIFATFYYLTALLHRISFLYSATLWWCLSGSGSAEAMLLTTQAMKQHYNPKDLNLHPYFSNDILVLTMGGGNEQLLALANTCIDCHSSGKEIYLGMLCFLQSFIHLQNGTHTVHFFKYFIQIHKVFVLLK
jgi:hypothetical protein